LIGLTNKSQNHSLQQTQSAPDPTSQQKEKQIRKTRPPVYSRSPANLSPRMKPLRRAVARSHQDKCLLGCAKPRARKNPYLDSLRRLCCNHLLPVLRLQSDSMFLRQLQLHPLHPEPRFLSQSRRQLRLVSLNPPSNLRARQLKALPAPLLLSVHLRPILRPPNLPLARQLFRNQSQLFVHLRKKLGRLQNPWIK
jgi:hypothetical protein